jgi:hypothetical protein
MPWTRLPDEETVSMMPPAKPSPASARPALPLRGGPSDLQAMKRALARAPLGPKATIALTHAILALEDELAREPSHAPPTPTPPVG